MFSATLRRLSMGRTGWPGATTQTGERLGGGHGVVHQRVLARGQRGHRCDAGGRTGAARRVLYAWIDWVILTAMLALIVLVREGRAAIRRAWRIERRSAVLVGVLMFAAIC